MCWFLIEFIVDNICLVSLLGLNISKCDFKLNLIFDVKLYFLKIICIDLIYN